MLFHTVDRLLKHRSYSNRAVFGVVFLTLLAISHRNTGANGECVSKKSQWGYTLEGSAYDSSPADNYPTCLLRCLTDNTRCKSLSYDLAAKTCELSVYSRWNKQWAYKPKTNSIYMEMLGVVEVYSNVTEQSSTPPPTMAAGAAGEPFNAETFCAGKEDGDYSHPTDCNQYVTCSTASKIARPCGVGMNFHPKNKVCDHASNVVCP
ncbi:uncharacterized protein LOC116288273 [Actinia tenebrosa]|uniref:Uncharacterized protein LOC116288273 n=1 Tax=Actinia tenebrosa TaxID=6105 RepID=A0A6P8HEB3_ACTTE|nr:uncharacterized protein LOC116288273 [Actinia tenebrosa]